LQSSEKEELNGLVPRSTGIQINGPIDANPIENLWHIIKNKTITLGPVHADELLKQIQNIWYNITSEICRNLVAAILKMKQNIDIYPFFVNILFFLFCEVFFIDKFVTFYGCKQTFAT